MGKAEKHGITSTNPAGALLSLQVARFRVDIGKKHRATHIRL